MRYLKPSWIAAGLVLLLGTVANGQTAVNSQGLRNLGNGTVMMTIQSGRIVNNGNWMFGNRRWTSSNGDAKEEFTIQGAGTSGSLQYQRTSPLEDFTLDLNSQGHLMFRCVTKGGSDPVTYELVQTAGEPITLTVGREGKQQVYKSPNVWHLLITQPEESRRYVVPVLEALHHNWQFSRLISAIEVELLKEAAGHHRSDRQQWAGLVAQLGDDSFAKREAADRQLRENGAAVLGYLEQLDFNRLDAEQQFRVRRIVRSISKRAADDTPEQIAAMLAEDPSVWLALLSRPEEATRRAAVQHLANMLGEPSIGVDPAADPATQKKQRDGLRERVEKLKSQGK